LRLSGFAGVMGVCLSAALAVPPVSAHHSISAQFDALKKVTLTGQVTKVDWANPHSYVYLDVKDERGRIVVWALEGSSPNTLASLGWTRDTIKPGDQVSALGYPSKDGAHLALAIQVTLPGGQRLTFGL
jgi:DNA/RNA endonuclease YhcR with UshA esterase domain